MSGCVVKRLCGATCKISVNTHLLSSTRGTCKLAPVLKGFHGKATHVQTYEGRGIVGVTQFLDMLPFLNPALHFPAITKTLVQLLTSHSSKESNVLEVVGTVGTRIGNIGCNSCAHTPGKTQHVQGRLTHFGGGYDHYSAGCRP